MKKINLFLGAALVFGVVSANAEVNPSLWEAGEWSQPFNSSDFQRPYADQELSISPAGITYNYTSKYSKQSGGFGFEQPNSNWSDADLHYLFQE